MLSAPWNLVLTIAFVFTGLVCLIDLAYRLKRFRRGNAFDGEILVDVNHFVMSAAMIWMSWSMESEPALWVQVAVFVPLTIAFLPLLRRAGTVAERIDLAGHVALNAAMIWMLAAMPLLMAGMEMDHGTDPGASAEGQMQAGDAGAGAMTMGTPMWADAVNGVFVAVSVATTLWWLYRLIRGNHHRIHSSCHTVMAAGMGAMLVLMNG